jgi:hypothetical protein
VKYTHNFNLQFRYFLWPKLWKYRQTFRCVLWVPQNMKQKRDETKTEHTMPRSIRPSCVSGYLRKRPPLSPGGMVANYVCLPHPQANSMLPFVNYIIPLHTEPIASSQRTRKSLTKHTDSSPSFWDRAVRTWINGHVSVPEAPTVRHEYMAMLAFLRLPLWVMNIRSG